MKDKATYVMGGVIIFLLVVVSLLINNNTRKDAQIKLLQEKLSTSESVNQGLKEGVERLIRYQECTAKILIAPRDLTKAIEGNIADPATALERCRIEVKGVPISENPPETQPVATAPNSPSPQSSSQPSTSSPSPAQTPSSPTPSPTPSNPPSQTPAPAPPQSILPGDQRPILFCILGVCI